MSRDARPAHVALTLLAALALGACGSDPTHFYTLLRPAAPADAPAGQGAYAIDVQRVRVPPQVDQPELVVRRGEGEVTLVETRRWVAPLGEEVRGALSAALSRTLGVRDVAQVGAPAGLPVYRIAVDVQRFDGWLAHEVGLEAVWTVSALATPQTAARRWTCASRIGETVAPGYEALVAGAQRAVERLAAEIAARVRAAQADAADAACPG